MLSDNIAISVHTNQPYKSENMELPICHGTYTSESYLEEISFLRTFAILLIDYEYDNKYYPFFAGLCYSCYEPRTPEQSLQRCGGCQLVAYCSRSCQEDDWSLHRKVCKEFPIVKGKNALQTDGSWKNHINGLRERAARLPKGEISASPIFHNPRVCRTCKEARQDRLTDCSECAYVSYCSRKCKKADKQHPEDCRTLIGIGILYRSRNLREKHLPSLRNLTVNYEFQLAYDWNDIMPDDWTMKAQILSAYDEEVRLEAYLTSERLGYPMSLLYALQSLPERRLGQDHLPLEEQTTLNIHVVTSVPIMDSEPWEIFMHRLPKLKNLQVTFIVQGKPFKQSFYHNNQHLSLKRCDYCARKNRVITYSVHKMLYHMYFSSPDYTEPDVVIVYGNSQEMSLSEDDDTHSKLSYRNMTHCPATVLVLTDTHKDLLKQGVRAVNAARPVTQLVAPQKNFLMAYNSNLSEINSGTAVSHDRYHFTCLKRK